MCCHSWCSSRRLVINNTISRHHLLLWFSICSIFRHSLPSTLCIWKNWNTASLWRPRMAFTQFAAQQKCISRVTHVVDVVDVIIVYYILRFNCINTFSIYFYVEFFFFIFFFLRRLTQFSSSHFPHNAQEHRATKPITNSTKDYFMRTNVKNTKARTKMIGGYVV